MPDIFLGLNHFLLESKFVPFLRIGNKVLKILSSSNATDVCENIEYIVIEEAKNVVDVNDLLFEHVVVYIEDKKLVYEMPSLLDLVFGNVLLECHSEAHNGISLFLFLFQT